MMYYGVESGQSQIRSPDDSWLKKRLNPPADLLDNIANEIADRHCRARRRNLIKRHRAIEPSI